MKQHDNPSSTVSEDNAHGDRAAPEVDHEHRPRLAFAVVGVGASAGGLDAYTEFLQACRPDSGMAFVLIQHLSPKHESIMADLLAKTTSMPVLQVEDGMPVQANHVYFIRPGYTMTIRDGRLHLGESAASAGHRRPVDDFFRSLAEEQRERAICVILSGAGSNGTAGAEQVKACGGFCIAQDPETAKFPSMPRSLIDSGIADAIFRPAEMFAAIEKYANNSYSAGRDESAEALAQRERLALASIISILRARAQHDFGGYKKATLARRIQRRMSLLQLDDMNAYARALRQSPGEVTALADDLMIHVTGFFRDDDVWESLRAKVIAPLIQDKAEGESIRVWVTACSSGEEAFTLAILLVEAAEAAGKTFDIKIFATDTARRSLTHARTGLYPGGIESEISPARLQRFFEKSDAFFRVKKELRELIVFAPQNVLQDPPFSRLDIATCRNLLIYIESDVQRRVLSALHFGLRENGCLLLGNSETVGGAEDLFEPIDKKHRIFRRVGSTPLRGLALPGMRRPPALPSHLIDEAQHVEEQMLARSTIATLASHELLERHTPAAVVIDRDNQIVYFHGNTSRFLAHPRGEPTRDLMFVARDEIRVALHHAIHEALTTNEASRNVDSFLGIGTDRRRVIVVAAPLKVQPVSTYLLVSFQEIPEPAAIAPAIGLEDDAAQLNGALRRVQHELQSTIEELQTSNEEMKASHEEVTSVNEELQSSNEELETSKEELQSLNEELSTVNAQLQTKMEELERISNDLGSLLSSTDIAVIFLDLEFRIRRFTPAVKDLLELIPGDVGRPLSDLRRKFEDPHLVRDAQDVLDRLLPLKREVISESGRWYVRHALPYRTVDNRINGVVVTFVDITERKAAEMALRGNEERLRRVVSIDSVGILFFDNAGRVTDGNDAFLWLSGYSREEINSGFISWEKITPVEWHARTRLALEQVRTTGHAETYEKASVRKDGTVWWGLFAAQRVDATSIVEYVIDLTERHRAEQELVESQSRIRMAAAAAAMGFCEWDLRSNLVEGDAACYRLLGVEKTAAAESFERFVEHVHPDDRQATMSALREAVRTRSDFKGEFRTVSGERGIRWLAAFGRNLEGDDAKIVRVIGCLLDITDRRLADEQRIELLESERVARALAERANAAKDEFLATLGHELRTPLSAIMIWTKLLENPTLDEAQRAEGLAAIQQSADAQKQLIDDLLDSSRITSGKLRLEMIDTPLVPLLRSAIEAVAPTADVKGVILRDRLDADCGVIRADTDRLRQIVWNLLTNAVKFTPQGGTIEVSASRVQGGVEIRVSDDGRGIEAAFLPHIFKRFSQSDPAMTRTSGGIGLGLSIVKQLVELHGGTVTAESPGLNRGTIFKVRLPLARTNDVR